MIDTEKYQPARQNMKFSVEQADMYRLSGCELIDTENISLLSQNMKSGGE
jgi:hypothetical protein